ncbi:hypothetical protein [Polynucleobacter sp. MWH-UH2A]|uniref:hypothetical protein n=1 Tax=Polynucleobacter sp. MWH-UH2A TaxID=1855617 RepID=UPI001BFE86CE|nr:hypothetical protein [Polynucleobacter sp. MWH-UH2A]QWD63511.1 hypothetical protein IC571_07390 [Polynucleobacter sp. MWH-UH2A]
MSTKTKVASSKETKTSRRMFFIGASAAVGTVAVASNTSVGKAITQEIAGVTKDSEETKSMTEHMRKYYASTMI